MFHQDIRLVIKIGYIYAGGAIRTRGLNVVITVTRQQGVGALSGLDSYSRVFEHLEFLSALSFASSRVMA